MSSLVERSRSSNRYSMTQIVLHWLTVLLIMGQWYTSSAIHRTHNPLLPPSQTDLFQHAMHTYSGLLIGVIMAFRLGLSFLNKVAPLPTLSSWQNRLSRMTHKGLYLLVFCQVATGIVATYLWSPAGLLHVYVWNLVLVLASVHVGASVYHLIRGDDVLGRMIPWRR